MGTGGNGTAGYGAVFADPAARRLWTASAVSYLGDFVGLGAQPLSAYQRSGGHPLGPAAVFGVQALPAVLVASSVGPWLDQAPRRQGLVALCALGAAALTLPLMLTGLWPVLVTAGLLGGVRTACNSVRTGAIADAVPRDTRGRLVAGLNAASQVSEVFGYLAGSAIALAIGPGPALLADAGTFCVAALVVSGLDSDA